MYREEFALRLALLRTKMNISARDMSLALGQNPGYINSIENGKSLPSMAMFFYICEFLRITPAEFFTAENKYPAQNNKIIESLSQLDNESLESITRIIEKLAKAGHGCEV